MITLSANSAGKVAGPGQVAPPVKHVLVLQSSDPSDSDRADYHVWVVRSRATRGHVIADHKRLFRRMFEMLAKSGVLEEVDGVPWITCRCRLL